MEKISSPELPSVDKAMNQEAQVLNKGRLGLALTLLLATAGCSSSMQLDLKKSLVDSLKNVRQATGEVVMGVGDDIAENHRRLVNQYHGRPVGYTEETVETYGVSGGLSANAGGAVSTGRRPVFNGNISIGAGSYDSQPHQPNRR